MLEKLPVAHMRYLKLVTILTLVTVFVVSVLFINYYEFNQAEACQGTVFFPVAQFFPSSIATNFFSLLLFN